MSNPADEHLPPELSDIDERLRATRPAPTGPALERAMSRARGASVSGKSSLLWASIPRMRGRMRAIAVAGALGIVALTGGAAILNSSGSGGSSLPTVNGKAADHQYCPSGLLFLQAQLAIAEDLLAAQLQLLPQFRDPLLIAQLELEIADLEAQIIACGHLP